MSSDNSDHSSSENGTSDEESNAHNLFIIDTVGQVNQPSINIVREAIEECRVELEKFGLLAKEKSFEDEVDINKLNPFDKFALEMGWIKDDDINLGKIKQALLKKGQLKKKRYTFDLDAFMKDDKHLRSVLEQSDVLKSDFHKQHTVPMRDLSKKVQRKERRKESEKTKGKNWFNLPAPEVTDELKRDLEVLQMRSVLDPKHFYKKNDLKVLPKYFQVGKVMDSPLDFHSNRLTRKERKQTLVDELMADAEFNRYNKRKYNEIVAEKQKTDFKAYRASRKHNKKKKNKTA